MKRNYRIRCIFYYINAVLYVKVCAREDGTKGRSVFGAGSSYNFTSCVKRLKAVKMPGKL